MLSVLIVEDSRMVMKVLKHVARKSLSFDVVFAGSAQEAKAALAEDRQWLAAIVDLNLPDAPNGEMVQVTLEAGIPTIVLTGSVDDQKRESLLRHGIVDYVLKEGAYSYQYAVNLVNRLYKNRRIKVMVAEDSVVTRRYIVELLRRHQFQVYEAENGQQALDSILREGDIELLLTDYNMPELNGFELIHALRYQHDHMDLVIIGLSSADDKHLSAKFIKNGANDFLYKPFSHEEFFCRIMHDVESMERMKALHAMAYTDALTDIGNRRYFIEKARAQLRLAEHKQMPLSLATLDIDYFKQINDQYGHEVGDEILIAFTQSLQSAFGRFLLARTGGAEFCVLFSGLPAERSAQLVDALREQIDQEYVLTLEGEISYTFSAGVSQLPAIELEGLMKTADRLLYQAKENGRNGVVFEQ